MKHFLDALNLSITVRIINLSDEDLLNEYEQFLSTLSNESCLRDKELYSVIKQEILRRMHRFIIAYA